MRSFLLTLLLAVTGLSVRAQTVLDIIRNSPDHNTLEALIDSADLNTVLDGAGTFTVFAPTDAAFNALPAGTVQALLSDRAQLAFILTYHVLGAEVVSTAIPAGLAYGRSLADNLSIQIVNDGGAIQLNANADVTVADLDGTNGVVHVINAVILPFTITEAIAISPQLNTLETAVGLTAVEALLDEVNDEDFYTLFAPTDGAFDTVDPAVLQALLADEDALTEVLAYHALDFEVRRNVIPNPFIGWVETLSSYAAQILRNNNTVFVNSSQVLTFDIVALNGTIHTIDGVLLPPTVADIVSISVLHQTLGAAVGAAGLQGALSDPSADLTLFAPTDGAFRAVDSTALAALLADVPALQSVLLYHALGQEVASNELPNGLSFARMLAGFSAQFEVTPGTGGDDDVIEVDNSEVLLADLLATNGVVHVIGDVLLPPDVVDVAVRSPVHSTLVQAVTAAGLVGTLQDDNAQYTVFAPTDDAFAAVPSATLQALLDDPTGKLTTVLTYHVLADSVSSSTIVSSGITSAPTIQGESVDISIRNGNVFLDSTRQVIIADIYATNGIVHVLNGVLIPDAILSSSEPAASVGISMSPSPADTYTNVSVPVSFNQNMMLRIYDLQGRELNQRSISAGVERVDVSQMAAGLYYFVIEAEGRSFYQAVAVQ